MDFKDKIVLVTGSSRGIGAQTVYDFAKNGANVIINYNNDYDSAEKLKEKIEKELSGEVLLIKCDVSSDVEVSDMIDTISNKYGKIDILVNNAGICNDTPFLEKTGEDFLKVLSVNLVGTFLVSKYASKIMKEGKIINIASDNAVGANYPESAEYDSSKAGIISLTHNMAKYFSPKMTVNCVCPGWIDTDMNKDLSKDQLKVIENSILINRIGKASEVSNVIMFLASDKASFVNDSIIIVNGGLK